MKVGPLALAGLVAAGPAAAQEVSVGAARWLTSPHVTDYRLGVARHGMGPLLIAPFGQVALQGPATDGVLLVGAGAEVVLRLSARARPYLAASASGGFLDLERTTGLRLWGSWSAGLGTELLRARPVALAVELRYQELSRGRTRGVSVGARIGTPLGRRSPPGGPPESRVLGAAEPRLPGAAEPRPGDAVEPRPVDAADWAAARRRVTDAALEAMGTPYRWGGTDANGFDCSGLIQFAYAEAGLQLPRRSADQARAGREVPRQLDALEPGDILAFSASPGGEVTHVGLYLGEQRFIHSASGGVRIGRLAPDEVESRWWVERWVGARRLLESR